MANEITFEQIEEKINNADLTAFASGGSKHFSIADIHADPGSVLVKVCGIYHVIHPILEGVVLIPIIPRKWKEGLKTFMGLMDTLCS